MACIITYKNNKYSQQEFEKYFKNNFNEFVNEFLSQDIEGFKEFTQGKQFQYLNKQIAINNLFETNGDFASKIYEALGFTVNISDEQKQQQTDPLENKDLKDNKNLNTIESVINQIKNCKS